MSKKRILFFVRLLLAVTGIVCITFCIFSQGDNQVLLSLGLMCNSISLLLMPSRKKEE